jgi:RNA polymerase sigma-70 factor (ECF subfamily)
MGPSRPPPSGELRTRSVVDGAVVATWHPVAVASAGSRRADTAASAPPARTAPDPDSRAWLERLQSDGQTRDQAIAELHAFLVRAARHEAERRRPSLPAHMVADLGELVEQAAGDAAIGILRKLDTYRGESRFTTWAFKFAIFEVSALLRRAAWRDRPIVLDAASWERLAERSAQPDRVALFREMVVEIRRFVATDLTPRQREVFTAVVVDEVPMDVLAERLDTSRGAIYKILHDARAKLRTRFADRAWDEPTFAGGGR